MLTFTNLKFKVHAQPALPANYEVMEPEPVKPAWACEYSLKLRGTYYEGFVEDLESLLTKFEFKAETVTTFGLRRSRYIDGTSTDRTCEPSAAENQENHTTVL